MVRLAAGAGDGAIVERVAQVEVVPAQRGELLEAQARPGRHDDQRVVVGWMARRRAG